MTRRLFARALATAAAGFALLQGCDPAATPAPVVASGPESAPGEAAGAGCSLEAAFGTFAQKGTPPACGESMPFGVCDEGCKESVRKCVLESARAERPFAIDWTNAMVNGVGTRRGVMGRVATSADGSRTFEIAWLDYVWSSGFDAIEATMTKHRIRIHVRWCTEIADLRQSCDPRLGTPSAMCGQSAKKLADDAWMQCEGAEEVFCSE